MHPQFKNLLSHDLFSQAREFLSWRGLEDDEQYTCVVEHVANKLVRIKLDIIEFSIKAEAAREIAECLKDALVLAINSDDENLTARERPFGFMRRKYRKRVSGWQYSAKGVVVVHHASYEFFKEVGLDSGSTSIEVCSIPGGGYEIAFDFMCYSFTAKDAVWLSAALVAACQNTEEFHSRTPSMT
jgi:hypothetical protein